MSAAVQIIATREQKDALKAQGWRVVGTWGGGSYIMESPGNPHGKNGATT